MSDGAPRFCAVRNILSWKVAASKFALLASIVAFPAICTLVSFGIQSGPISLFTTRARKSGFLGSVRLNLSDLTCAVYLSFAPSKNL
eukprot:CAMPEP_0206221292 /NCGR_PEP_ID=MMETSP0047_2-20121206/5330_1 /ASSEMBLY_ACC=CAM_ASM_000192 /TAXON_ID=195065 /ORGANISM="Chroomonas mesostigmatica_cf, Strain CCMP1168" /LENGTH=86 /DNA_ID=CAMNT_0053644003 /DNA_START=99 /DNA_END=359 /DNA_ORIENTATION=-